MSNLRKRQAINSDQETYGITERRVRNTLLWANVDNNVSNTNENTELLRPVGKQTGKVLELSFKSGVGGFEIPESYFTSSATNASALNVPIVFVGSENLTNFTDTANSRSVSGEEWPVGKQTGKVLELSFKSGVGGFEIPESYFTSSATNASALNVPIVFVGSETLTNFTDTANSRSVSGEELVFQLKFIKQMNLNPDSSIDSSYIRYNILNHGYNYKVGDSFVIIEQNLRIGGDATKNLVVTIEKIN